MGDSVFSMLRYVVLLRINTLQVLVAIRFVLGFVP